MKFVSTLLCIFGFSSIVNAAGPAGEVVSMKCSLAIEAAIQEMNKQSNNLVVREALESIDEEDGEFICVRPNESQIYVRLQSKSMTAEDNKLMFTINAKTYAVLKTYYGR